MLLKNGHCKHMFELETLIDKYNNTLEVESPTKKDQAPTEDLLEEEQAEA